MRAAGEYPLGAVGDSVIRHELLQGDFKKRVAPLAVIRAGRCPAHRRVLRVCLVKRGAVRLLRQVAEERRRSLGNDRHVYD